MGAFVETPARVARRAGVMANWPSSSDETGQNFNFLLGDSTMAKKNTIETEEKKVVKRTSFSVELGPFDTAVPAGFNFGSFKPLKKKSFKQEALYYDHRAAEMQYKKDLFENEAQVCRTQGSAADRAKARRIVKLQSTIDKLKEQLIAQGFDVAGLLSKGN